MESLHYLLMKAHTELNRRIITSAADLGLTSGQPKILDTLLHFGDCNQKTIAGYCEIEPATMGSLLLRMEKAGLIRRYQKDGNRRSLYVTLTDEGRAAATEMDAIFRQEDARAVQALTEAETRQLKDLLARVGDTLGRDAGQDGAQ